MPTRPFTAMELEDAEIALALAIVADEEREWDELLDVGADHSDGEEEILLTMATEPLCRSLHTRIGPERLSVARLEREAADAGAVAHKGNAVSVSVVACCAYVRLPPLPHLRHPHILA